MRKSQKIGGFAVEAMPVGSGHQIEWSVWLSDLPYVRASAPSLADARRHLKSGGNSWSLPIGLPVNLCHVQFVAGVIGRFWTRFTSSVRDAAAVFSECLGSAVMKPCSRSVFAVQPQCDAMNLPCACSGSAVLMQHFAWRGCWQLAIRHFALLLLPSPGLACPETRCTITDCP